MLCAPRALAGRRVSFSRIWRRHLTGATFQDRLRILTFLAGRWGRRLRRFLALPSQVAERLFARPPERLIIAPQDIRTSDPTIAAEIGAGYFAFGGKIVNAHGRSPFATESGSDSSDRVGEDETWARQLAGFGWLRHLRATDDPHVRGRGRVLVSDFLAAFPRPVPGPQWEPAVAARRLLAWLSQSPVLLQGADRTFYLRFMQALETHRASLERQLSSDIRGTERLLAVLALAEYGLCVQGAPALQRRGSLMLANEIDAQVLPDGGHVSRNPQAIIDLLLDLLPLRQAHAARGVQAPQQLLNAIDRMVPMLRLFRHGDGSLALFNGMGITAPELIATILAYDDARSQPIANARYAGYQRLEAETTLVIADSGPCPPKSFSAQAHAGCLSFELSSSIRRILVNCGAPEGARAAAREAARTTAAHSTLVIDDISSCRFASTGRLERWLGNQILAGPSTVSVDRIDTEAGTVLAMSHDGYARRFGIVHKRELRLFPDGKRLDGTDTLVDSGKRKMAAVPYVVRFHLHPSIRARVDADSSTIRLDAPDGESWLFGGDAPAVIEPGVLFAATGGPRPTSVIKIAANSGTRCEICWSFRQIVADERHRD